MSPVSEYFRRSFATLKEEQFAESGLPELYSALRPAHPLMSKPPFFPGKSFRQRTLGRALLWPFAKVVPGGPGLFELAYSPAAGAPIVFKEVTFIKPLKNLLERTSVPVAYLVRHPCATVLSEVSGQKEGLMPSGRQVHLREIVERLNPGLAEEFRDVIEGADTIQRVALLWRCEIEACVPLVMRSTRGLLVSYEQLAIETEDHTRRILAHFGVAYDRQTQRYIDFLRGLKSSSAVPAKRTGWGKKYFSIYRNPVDQHDAWKRRISSTDREKIFQVLKTSSVFEECARLGSWD